MGEVGEYWNEHKAYKRRKSLGMSEKQYARMQREMAQENAAARKAAHIARSTIQCECGKWLENVAAHNGHKNKTGRLGHKVIATKEAEVSKPFDGELF